MTFVRLVKKLYNIIINEAGEKDATFITKHVILFDFKEQYTYDNKINIFLNKNKKNRTVYAQNAYFKDIDKVYYIYTALKDH